MDDRLPGNRLGLSPRARFRCLPCKRFVRATDAGVCPRCAWAPPVARPHVFGPAGPLPWTRIALVATAVGLALYAVLR